MSALTSPLSSTDPHLTPFERALREEERWIVNIVDRPIPTDALAGHRCYIGPTKAEIPPALERAAKPQDDQRERQIRAAIRAREADLFKEWRGKTAAFHSRRSQRWIDPKHPNRSF